MQVLNNRYDPAVPIGDIKPNPRNANRGNVHEIARSIVQNGFYGACIVNERTGYLVAGEHRWLAAKGEGAETIPVLFIDADAEAERKILLSDNAVTRHGEWDMTALIEELEAIKSDFGTLVGTGFDEDALAKMADEMAAGILAEDKSGNCDDDDAPEPESEPISRLNDLWICGDHRVMCGDSTDKEQVATLMAGQLADMVFTDPPYGVNYEGGHFHSGDVNIKRKREKLAADNDSSIYERVVPIISEFTSGPCYMWFAHSRAYDVFKSLHDNQCEVSAVLVWHKTNATYAAMNSQYKQRHEPCVYFKPKNSTLRWMGASTESTLWEEKRDSQNTLHPTQKPVCLAERALGNHDANVVMDLFGGSGSTLIACEKRSRQGRLMEIHAPYVDVIVRRWQTFTGNSATLENDRRTFEQITAEQIGRAHV